MSNTAGVQDADKVLGVVAKLALKERPSEAEGADLNAALTPVIRSVVAKTVWRRSLPYGAYQAAVGDAVQEAWLITLRDILPRFDRKRGNLISFVRRCLRRRLINWVERGQNDRLLQLADPNAVADRRSGDGDNAGIPEELRTLIERALRLANVRDRKIFRLRMAGASYAEIAREMGMSEVALRGVVYRLLNRVRPEGQTADS